jgi:hypothetical protein
VKSSVAAPRPKDRRNTAMRFAPKSRYRKTDRTLSRKSAASAAVVRSLAHVLFWPTMRQGGFRKCMPSLA